MDNIIKKIKLANRIYQMGQIASAQGRPLYPLNLDNLGDPNMSLYNDVPDEEEEPIECGYEIGNSYDLDDDEEDFMDDDDSDYWDEVDVDEDFDDEDVDLDDEEDFYGDPEEPYDGNWIIEQQGKIMLVLTRRRGESIEIAPDIKVTIIDIKNGSVRVGIDAPKDIKILRTELVSPPIEPYCGVIND